jgi:hypothetical protein
MVPNDISRLLFYILFLSVAKHFIAEPPLPPHIEPDEQTKATAK